MSSGAFEDGKYGGLVAADIYPCRAQPESKGLTLNAVANSYPVGATTSVISARLKSSTKRIGINARTVRVQLTAVLAGYKPNAILTIPVFTQAAWNSYGKGQTGTYQATAVRFVGKTGENIK